MTQPKHALDAPHAPLYSLAYPDSPPWVYGIITALVPLLVVYGLVEEATAPLWLALASSVLGTTTALLHTPAGGGDGS